MIFTLNLDLKNLFSTDNGFSLKSDFTKQLSTQTILLLGVPTAVDKKVYFMRYTIQN